MKKKKILILILCLIIITLMIISYATNKKSIGKVYFNMPVSWDQAYAYVYDENGKETFEKWPGIKLINEEDYIYYFELETNKNVKYNIIFNDGNKYKIEDNYIGYDKIYNVTNGIGEIDTETKGEWLEYDENIKIGKIPRTQKNIKNVIYMIGDGMGENHIIAGELYKGEELYIQSIKYKTYIKTASTSTITDSAAAGTALATGYKTNNGIIGKDKFGNNVQNLIEYANSRNMKTGIVCTQILNHATPASFFVHNINRDNYEEIAKAQIESEIDLMFGGGKEYFSKYSSKMVENNYKWITEFSEIEDIAKNDKIIGTFAEKSISKKNTGISLSDMTTKALSRLKNENGFLILIEGSNIDSYSHQEDMNNMLQEMLDFDDAVGIAISYVKDNPDTLLIITADHETGGLELDGINSKEQLTDSLFKANGEHTERNVELYAYGVGAEDITKYEIIDNTSIYNFIKQALEN